MKTDERFDYFCSQWEELSDSDKVNLFNEYCSYTGCEETIYSFDEEFFDTFFEGRAMEAARATFFGEIQSWFDSYIKFNGYGNLESLSEYQAAELAGCYQREIYDWDRYEDYIDMDEYDYPEEEEEEEEEDDL